MIPSTRIIRLVQIAIAVQRGCEYGLLLNFRASRGDENCELSLIRPENDTGIVERRAAVEIENRRVYDLLRARELHLSVEGGPIRHETYADTMEYSFEWTWQRSGYNSSYVN